jgi:hypothetical protein
MGPVMRVRNVLYTSLAIALACSSPLAAQGTLADYEQAMTVRETYQPLAINVPDQANWIEKSNRVWYRRTVRGVNQLIKHNKDFDLLVIPGMGHGSGGAYGAHKRYDFFTRHLLGVTPPDWAMLDDVLKKKAAATTTTDSRQ